MFKPKLSTMLIMSLFLMSSLATLGAVNLSILWDFLTEIVDNTDVIVGVIILGVIVAIVVYFGDFIKDILGKATGGKRR